MKICKVQVVLISEMLGGEKKLIIQQDNIKDAQIAGQVLVQLLEVLFSKEEKIVLKKFQN